MRYLIREYGEAVAARACAMQVAIASGYTPPKDAPLVIAAVAREAKALEALQDAVSQASAIVGEVVSDVEAIAQANPQRYADDPAITEGYRANFDRPYNARRPFTMKDAKPMAARCAKQLREVWTLIDPPLTNPFK